MSFLYIAVGVIVLGIVFVAWGMARLRKRNAQVNDLIRRLKIGDLNHLMAEARERLLKCYGVTIDLQDGNAAAKALSDLFDDKAKLESAFSKKNVSWYFVFPIGSLVGEFMRIHARGVWKSGSDGLYMEIPVEDGTATCYPFEKVLKQFNQGAEGDLFAFLKSSTALSSLDAGKSSPHP
ncbi:MAG TPA: hypothetical protein VG938_14830 [Verrucomicrobiae bacterium]|nr:hypothetical protein [Verrucomicrobiae bacterium]